MKRNKVGYLNMWYFFILMTFEIGNVSAFSIIYIQFLKFKDCEKATKFEF